MIVYIRNRGPICYEVPLFDNHALLAELPRQLLSSDLSWCWESMRLGPMASTSDVPDLPPKRPVTQLTLGNAASLIGDFRERNIDGYGRFVAIFGVDPDTVVTLLDEARLRSALYNYSTQEEGPIRIVLIQIGDQINDYIFVPHRPIEPVSRLLETWGIHPAAVYKTRRYKKLGVVTLESLYGLSPGSI